MNTEHLRISFITLTTHAQH